MDNHFHLVVETPRSNVQEELKKLGWIKAGLKWRRKRDDHVKRKKGSNLNI